MNPQDNDSRSALFPNHNFDGPSASLQADAQADAQSDAQGTAYAVGSETDAQADTQADAQIDAQGTAHAVGSETDAQANTQIDAQTDAQGTAYASAGPAYASSAEGEGDGLTSQGAAFFRDRFKAILHEVKKDILTPKNQEDFVRDLLLCVFAKGHALLEGKPGLGKTLLVRALGRALGLEFGRIQFTPDLMPSDITGTTVLQTDAGGNIYQEFRQGPVFANIVLADEINRASPKTQSSLLEVMAERQLTVAGVTYRPGQNYVSTPHISAPQTGVDANGLFHVLATQNPIEQEGTYPLPEAQLDRFLFKLIIPSPDADLMARIVAHTTGPNRQQDDTAQQVAGLTFEDIQYMQSLPPLVETAPSALDFAVRLCQLLNPQPGQPSALAQANSYVNYGPSPRGAQALILAAKTLALAGDEEIPTINDQMVASVARAALRHRVALNYRAVNDGVLPEDLIDLAIKQIQTDDIALSKGV